MDNGADVIDDDHDYDESMTPQVRYHYLIRAVEKLQKAELRKLKLQQLE